MKFLSLSNLLFSYESNSQSLVLNDLSFDLEKGEIACLMGSSGCGKTTALRVISGFESCHQGSIKIQEQEVSKLNPSDRKIGVVFQDYSLFPHLSVIQNIEFGLKHSKQSKFKTATLRNSRAMELLKLVDLEACFTKYPGELSGGQMQRVALARALAPEPELILMDEPFSNLDPNLRKDLSQWLRPFLKKLQTTCLIVTHDIQEGLNIADKVGYMDSGKLVSFGTPEEVCQTVDSLKKEYPNQEPVSSLKEQITQRDLEIKELRERVKH
jgi:iron(III) transport system ATP-binding protein